MTFPSELKLWRFLFDFLEYLPPAVFKSLMQFVLKTSFTPNQTSLLTGLILSSCRNPRIFADADSKNILKRLIDNFEIICGHENTIKKQELKLTTLLNLLKILLQFTSQETLSVDETFRQLLFSDLPADSPPNYIDKKQDDTYHRNFEKVLNVFKILMSSISFDDWIESGELGSELVLQSCAEVSYWPADSAAPSNMQRLIAHYQALCCEALEVRHVHRNVTLICTIVQKIFYVFDISLRLIPA